MAPTTVLVSRDEMAYLLLTVQEHWSLAAQEPSWFVRHHEIHRRVEAMLSKALEHAK